MSTEHVSIPSEASLVPTARQDALCQKYPVFSISIAIDWHYLVWDFIVKMDVIQ